MPVPSRYFGQILKTLLAAIENLETGQHQNRFILGSHSFGHLDAKHSPNLWRHVEQGSSCQTCSSAEQAILRLHVPCRQMLVKPHHTPMSTLIAEGQSPLAEQQGELWRLLCWR